MSQFEALCARTQAFVALPKTRSVILIGFAFTAVLLVLYEAFVVSHPPIGS
jgi:hypothetical protein